MTYGIRDPTAAPPGFCPDGRQHVTWEQRFGALIELEGDEWDAEHDRLEQDWLAVYTVTFVEIALSHGWRRDDAVTWPVGIGGEAFIEAYRYDWDPRQAAEADVVACEDPPEGHLPGRPERA